MTDIEILMEVFGYSEEVAVAEYYKSGVFSRQTIVAYRTGYEKGESVGYKEGYDDGYNAGYEVGHKYD